VTAIKPCFKCVKLGAMCPKVPKSFTVTLHVLVSNEVSASIGADTRAIHSSTNLGSLYHPHIKYRYM